MNYIFLEKKMVPLMTSEIDDLSMKTNRRMASTGLSLRSILSIVTIMEIFTQPSSCLERFGWLVGEPCDSIPFPFGTPDKALPGFGLNCYSGEANLLPSNNQSYVIRAIHVNTVSVSVGSIYNRCYVDNGSEIIEDNSGLLNLFGTPYSISTSENVLVHVGCDNVLKININSTHDGFTSLSGCVVFCESHVLKIEEQIRGACSGLGCCSDALPGGGMTSFDLEFERISSGTNNRFSNCSISFIAEKTAAVSIGLIFSEQRNNSSLILGSKDKKYYPYIQTLTLEWSIGSSNCEEARKRSDYHCKINSDCYDSEIGGYFCNCSKGFQGNPYVLGGCTGKYNSFLCKNRRLKILFFFFLMR
jgi:hypothetical protein